MERNSPSMVTNQFVLSTGQCILLAIIAALLNIAIFPRLDFPWLSLFCFVPLFLLIPGNRPGRLFWYFSLAGFLFRLGNLYWIYFVIEHYSKVHPLLVVGILILLCIMLALYWGVIGWLLGFLASRIGLEKALWIAPFTWIVLEWLLNILQFPWDLTGYSLYREIRIAQLASWFGVYGLSWLIVAVNASIAIFIVLQKSYYSVVLATLTVIAALYGEWRTSQPIRGESLEVGVVQANIPQDVKINYQFAEEVNRKHIQMTKELLQNGKPDIVFWSESATMYSFPIGGEWSRQVMDLARSNRTPILLGSDAYVDKKVFNSSFLIDERGGIAGQYSKMYLVPFGEFVPLKRLFFFADKLVPEISDFSPGESYTQFPLKDKTFAVNICFEIVFPQLARSLCNAGSGLLVTITNDAWFGRTCAPYQHFTMAVMRSIENRRYLVRAANTGISGIIDPYGRILKRTDIFVPATFLAQLQFVNEKTFYMKHGDLLIYFSIFIVFVSLWVKRSSLKKEESWNKT
jgi:apolipoprotein N-acyltransferase